MERYVVGSKWDVNSRIFWRIAAGLFASILIIEVVLLLYSWFTERERIIDRLEETVHIVSTSLDSNNPTPQLVTLIGAENASSKYPITAFVLRSADGEHSSGGNFAAIEQLATLKNPTYFNSQNGDYVQFIQLNSEKTSGLDQSLWLRVDASYINSYMNNYVIRILAMVLVISLFVTIACLILLKPVLINPLLRLDRLLVRGQKQGIASAIAEQNDLKRSDELGSVFRSFKILRDQLVEAEVHSSRITERFEEFANMGADCFWEMDTKLVFDYVTGDVQKVLGICAKDMHGCSLEQLALKLNNRVVDTNSIYRSLHSTGTWEGKIFELDEDSNSVALRISSIPLKSKDGNLIGFRGTIKDISKETDLAEELVYQATHDELTRLSNRRDFVNQLEKNMSAFLTDGTVFSLICFDLDNFKSVNDSAGHAAGDVVLKRVSRVMKRCIGENDVAVRLGGDEFCIIVCSTGADGARAIAENVRREIASHNYVWGRESYKISASVGLATVTDEIATPEGIALAADTCCIAAKKSGKNRLKVFGHDDESERLLFQGESEWITLIMRALSTDGFSLFRQSIVRIDRTEEKHFEILMRMPSAEGGFHSPADFLPVAERNKLMPRIDKWVVSNSLKWLENQEISEHVDFCMNINLSAASLSDADFRAFLLSRVNENANLNKYVCFEVTESSAMTNLKQTTELLTSLRGHGCKIALDDFGTGFSSLSHIRELPLDYIKIDGSFIKEICESKLDQALVKSVSEIAKVLGIKTVAEFVDSTEALCKLEELDIDYAQGFLFSKPEPLESMPEASSANKAA